MASFKVLKGNTNFEWGEVQSQAFKKLKEHLYSLPTLARPITGETLYLYIAITLRTVSAVLVKEENKVQLPIYFMSRLLLDAETRYMMIEKAVYVVVVAGRKLRPYIDAHFGKEFEKIERSRRSTSKKKPYLYIDFKLICILYWGLLIRGL